MTEKNQFQNTKLILDVLLCILDMEGQNVKNIISNIKN